MQYGYIKVAAATPDIRVADCEYNKQSIKKIMDECTEKGVKVLVLPELCITGYTCEDLFLQDTLLNSALKALCELVEYSEGSDMVCMIGMPFMKHQKLYNVCVAYQNGEILGIIPKTNIPNYSEFYEKRHFAEGPLDVSYAYVKGYEEEVPFGSKIIFQSENMPDLMIAAEICEDVWMPAPPSGMHVMYGATIIANLSAGNETTGKDEYRRSLVLNQSARLVSGYIYAAAGEGESTTDLVFSGHNIIAECGRCIKESERFTNGIIITELDLGKIVSERRRISTFDIKDPEEGGYEVVTFELDEEETVLTRGFSDSPFVPKNKADRDKRCEEILKIQAMGLKKRLVHTGCKQAVLGISGGLDSTLALLVTAKAFDMAGLDRSGILAVTMPCFGTTDRTYNNAVTLVKCLNGTLKEVDIKDAVRGHFRDIGQDEGNHDVTYENSQARERTQVLMDIANLCGGMVIGTGDMSELALGWATYNGDHMSMYGVNSSVPKTLVRHLVAYEAEHTPDEKLKEVLLDILDTPVSPELLPPSEGRISQKTEDIVGPYELHDFFIYYVLRFGYSPAKIYKIACIAFAGKYDKETIYKWLTTFYKRFFSQQFKRSCLPDGPKVGTVALSPRGDLRMPSDASANAWLQELSSLH